VERLKNKKISMKKIFYKIFKRYKVLETKFVTYKEGDKMCRDTHDKPEEEKWVLAKEEDSNRIIGMVYLCRRVRLME
jgi:hypothetical protein